MKKLKSPIAETKNTFSR